MWRRTFVEILLAQAAREIKARPHPRLFLNRARILELRAAIRTTHSGVWKAIEQQAATCAAQRPPQYRDEGDEEELWQREVGNRLPFLAMAFLMTGETAYLHAAREWSLASCGYPHWGVQRFEDTDLAAGHQLFGLALVYDWLYQDLDQEARDKIAATLLSRGEVMHRACSTQFWREEYLQNHLWVDITGLFAAALALDEQPRQWIDTVVEKYRRTEEALGPDGASQEGVGYWGYGVEYMLKFWHLAGDALGENPRSPWWKSTAAYRLYLSLPRNAWTNRNTIVDIADCPRSDWYGPDYMLRRLAQLYGDSHAQWLAAELESAGVTAFAARWLNLLWYDPAIPSRAPADLPALRHFADLGIVSARSDWSGNESLVVFKCGPAVGHQATRRFDSDPGGGHVHPDANHFVLFGAGEWLIRDDGYAWKQTGNHNTLLVGGQGQMGEGLQWFRDRAQLGGRAEPQILRAQAGAECDEMRGDALPAYPQECGLRRFVRSLYFLKPDVLIVVDDIEAEGERDLELRFHPEFAGSRQVDGAFLFRGNKALLRLEPLTADGVEIGTGNLPMKRENGDSADLFTVRLTARRARWRNAMALSWAAAGGDPVRVTLERGSGGWIFRAGKRTVIA